jgi:FkbM family methyltransferase
MAELQLGTFTASLAILFEKGIRYATVIDIGCADGSFYLQHCALGLFPDSAPLNIDANDIYEPSLRAIKEAVGGEYVIAAASDKPGELTLTVAEHPYWTSSRPPEDPYWERINKMSRGQTKVPAVTLNDVVRRLEMKPPFLLKLDVQGAEVPALHGARDTLLNTSAVICEADLDDFHAINGTLADAGFDLFDVTQPNRLPDHSLGWFYPVYTHRRIGSVRRRSFWNVPMNDAVVQAQIERRQKILASNAEMLRRIRATRAGASA